MKLFDVSNNEKLEYTLTGKHEHIIIAKLLQYHHCATILNIYKESWMDYFYYSFSKGIFWPEAEKWNIQILEVNLMIPLIMRTLTSATFKKICL